MQQYPKANGLEKERQLWLLSFALALLLVLIVFLAIGFLTIQSHLMRPITKRTPLVKEQVVIVMAPAEARPAPPLTTPSAPEPQAPRFTRTSADQSSAPPEKADFIGNHDTTATSDALPVVGAPNLPSQAGRDLPKRQIETAESRPQQGDLDHNAIAQKMSEPTPPTPITPTPLTPDPSLAPVPTTASQKPTPPSPSDPQVTEATEKTKAASPLLQQGDQAVERPQMPEKDIKPTVAQKAPTPEEEKSSSAPAELPKPKPQQDPNEPGFRGNQQKTQLSGSISRKGRSALNVANTAMGRYQAALSRAVEAEWHKNCTKYRDFITPGILTIRFVIGPDGAVRSISVVEMVDAGEVQKGFTLGSIRQAKIPPIPAELKAEIDDDPIELIYNFYF